MPPREGSEQFESMIGQLSAVTGVPIPVARAISQTRAPLRSTASRIRASRNLEDVISVDELRVLIEQGLITHYEYQHLNGSYFINRELIDERIALRAREAMDTVFTTQELFDDSSELEDCLADDESDESDDEDRTPEWRSIKPDDFHEHSIPTWSSEIERERITELYFSQVEYRLRWIFFREEKEGFRRRSNSVKPFSREDFLEKVAKREMEHELNTDTSTFYDWNIGATDFVLRLEDFSINEIDAMRIHFIYKGNGLEICYQDRIWDGQHYRALSQQWVEIE